MMARKTVNIAIFAIALALIVKGALAVNELIIKSGIAAPVSIRTPLDGSVVSYVTRTGMIEEFKGEVQRQWIKGLVLQVPDNAIQKIENVTVQIGKEKYDLITSDFLVEKVPSGFLRYTLTKDIRGSGSIFPMTNSLLNWPGDVKVFLAILFLTFSLGFFILALIFFVLGMLMRRKKVKPVLETFFLESIAPMKPGRNKARSHWLLAGLALLLLSLFFLERMEPFYFTRADNYDVELPVMLFTFNSIEKGVFPEWNPHQFLGVPIASMGTSGIFYPPRYIAYFISKYLLGNEYLMIEVLMIIHLILGYFAVFLLLRCLGIREMLSTLGALSFILSGYNLIAGRSTEIIIPMIVWMPLLLLCVVKLPEQKRAGLWVFWTGLIIGVFFQMGFPQIWAYAMGFIIFILILMLLSKRITLRRLLWFVPAGFLGLALAAPVLLIQLLEFQNILRESMGGDGIIKGISSMLLPAPLVNAALPHGMGSGNHNVMGQFYYSGTLFAAVGFLAVIILFGYLLAFKQQKNDFKQIVRENIWLLCFMFAFFLALGQENLIYGIFARFPVFNKLRNPVRFLPFVNLFMIMGSGVILEKWFRMAKRPKVISAILASFFLFLLLYHVSIARASWYTYSDMPPYPKLPAELSVLFNNGRVVSISPKKSTVANYVYSLNNNFATVYGVNSYDGYHDMQASNTLEYLEVNEHFKKDPVGVAKAYGIRWVLIHKTALNPVFCSNPKMYNTEKITEEDSKMMEKLVGVSQVKIVLPYLTVREITNTKPLAFFGCGKPLSVTFNASGAIVNVSSVPPMQSITVNVLWRPWMRAYFDGVETECSRDNWGRIVVKGISSSKTLLVKYSPPWGRGILLSLSLLLFYLLAYFYIITQERKKSKK